MSNRKFNLHGGKKGSALAVRVTPRASHNEIVELMEDGTIGCGLPRRPRTMKPMKLDQIYGGGPGCSPSPAWILWRARGP